MTGKIIVNETGCVQREWGNPEDVAELNAKINTCGSLQNIDTFVVISQSHNYSNGKAMCVDITAEIVCRTPFDSSKTTTNPAE